MLAVTAVATLAAGAVWWALHPQPGRDDSRPPKQPAEESTVKPGGQAESLAKSVLQAPDEYARFVAAGSFADLEDRALIGELLARFADPTAPPSSLYARDVLIRRLVDRDLSGAVAVARGGDPNLREPLITEVCRVFRLVEGEPGALAAGVILSASINVEAAIDLLARLSNGDTAPVADTLAAADEAQFRKYRWERLKRLIVEEPDRAFAEVAQLPDDDYRFSLNWSLVGRLGKTDPAMAIDMSTKIGHQESELLATVRGKVMKQWFASDYAAAKARVFSPDFPLRLRTLGPIVEILVAHDPDDAVEWATDHIANSDLRHEAFNGIAHELSRHAPEKGAALIKAGKLPAGDTRSFVSDWAFHDAPAAMEFAVGLGGSDRLSSCRDVLNQIASKDPDSAFEILESDLFSPEEKADILAYHLIRHDTTRYLELLGSLPDELASRKLEDSISTLQTDDRMEDARMIIDEIGPGSEGIIGDTQYTVTAMAETDPAAAARWVATFESSQARAYGVQNITDVWVRTDPAAAAAFARSFEPGTDEADRAALAIATRTVTSTPEGALAWLDTIASPSIRSSFLRSHITTLVALVPERLDTLSHESDSQLDGLIKSEKARRAYLLGNAIGTP
ncbi:hypothetical protein BH23VER1_BH23VER1_09330 [soil metagenome]